MDETLGGWILFDVEGNSNEQTSYAYSEHDQTAAHRTSHDQHYAKNDQHERQHIVFEYNDFSKIARRFANQTVSIKNYIMKISIQ